MSPERLAAMKRGRERALVAARKRSVERVGVYREWLKLDAAYFRLFRNGDLTLEQYRSMKPAVPPVPRDADYAALTS